MNLQHTCSIHAKGKFRPAVPDMGIEALAQCTHAFRLDPLSLTSQAQEAHTVKCTILAAAQGVMDKRIEAKEAKWLHQGCQSLHVL